jgi:hypothetical protein
MPNPDPSPATRFTPGQSGNPGGRPKGESLTARLRRYLDEEGEDGRTRAERFVERLAEMALAGNVHVMKMVLDRLDGKAIDNVVPPETIIRIEYADDWREGKGDAGSSKSVEPENHRPIPWRRDGQSG